MKKKNGREVAGRGKRMGQHIGMSMADFIKSVNRGYMCSNRLTSEDTAYTLSV